MDGGGGKGGQVRRGKHGHQGRIGGERELASFKPGVKKEAEEEEVLRLFGTEGFIIWESVVKVRWTRWRTHECLREASVAGSWAAMR